MKLRKKCGVECGLGFQPVSQLNNHNHRLEASATVLFFVCLVSLALPAGSRVHAFDDAAAPQNEAQVTQWLKTGVNEKRSAEALAAVQPWLNRNNLSSGEGLFFAGQAAERSGLWLDAIGYYQRLLLSENPDKSLAGPAADATYRLLLNVTSDSNGAYQFMLKDGNRIRVFGLAKRYDRWFLDEAQKRRDIVAAADRLTAMFDDASTDITRLHKHLDWLCSELEFFRKEDSMVYEAATRLAATKRIPAGYKARLNWAATVMPYNQKLDELRNANAPADAKLTDAPLAAAAQLIKAEPDRGPLLVAQGWGIEYDHFHSGNCHKRFEVEGQRKLDQLLAAVPGMSADRRDDLLALPIAQGRVKFDPQLVRDLVVKYPDSFAGLTTAHVPLFNKERTTVEDAIALAPQLARNPHPDAAIIRAIAASKSLAFSAIADAMMKSEVWRFDSVKAALELAHRSSTTQDRDFNETVNQYTELGSAYDKLKQAAKESDTKQRIAAFDALYKDLMSPAPRIPGALTLWDDLFTHADNAATIQMIKTMVADLSGDREYLLRRALERVRFGEGRGGAMPWQAVAHHNQFVYHRAPVQQAAAELITHLQTVLQKQLSAGTVNETVFGMWLHTVDPRDENARELIRTLAASAAYEKLDHAYRQSAADDLHFGYLALAQSDLKNQPRYVSESLLALPAEANDKTIQDALISAIKRAAEATEPIAIIGLTPVANMQAWDEKTRGLVFSLFKESAPLDSYPAGQGFEPLLQRLSKELIDAKKWSEAEAYLPGLWAAAAATDDGRFYRGATALIDIADAALAAEEMSLSLSFSRGGITSRVGDAIMVAKDGELPKLAGRLSQLQGKSAIALGIIAIPVDELDPAFPIFKSQAEFAIGNSDGAWELYQNNAASIVPVIRKLTVPYCLWLLGRNIDARDSDRAEILIKELMIWSRESAGAFTPTQDGELKIAYADTAFQRGALQTAKAWYRRVADAKEHEGTPLQYEAILRSVRVDRAGKDYDTALTELDQLMLVRDPALRTRVHFARAEVFYDQERYADAFSEASAVLKRDPGHPDALILLGQSQLEMRKLVDASEIELGISRDQKVIVPGELLKINLTDPALNISGIGADIEVEIWTSSGDREQVMLYQFGDDKTKFRAEIPTALGKRQPGDKVLQVLGRDEIRYGYSQRFRQKMAGLPPDPEIIINVASDADVALSAGAFPTRKGERQLDLNELGVSSAQQALGTGRVRPGNPVYLRINDPDQGKTDGIDEIVASIETSSGDIIPKLILKETGTHTGEFEATIPTGPAQALAFANESALGRDPNMVISEQAYPGWAGVVGSRLPQPLFTVDLNDNVSLGNMSIRTEDPAQAITHFVVQTSMDGIEWISRARYPQNPAPWSGKPQITAFATYGRNAIAISEPAGRRVPEDWSHNMEIASAKPDISYGAFTVANLTDLNLELPSGGHPGYSVLIRYRATFYQPATAIRTFRLTGLHDGAKGQTQFLLNGGHADADNTDPLTITRELPPGLHAIEIWHHESRSEMIKRKPVLLQDVAGKAELMPCPDSMFDPATFPEMIQQTIAGPTNITASGEIPGAFEIEFGKYTRGRLVRLAIVGHRGPAPAISKITLTDFDGERRLPVATDYQQLRANDRLEILPGDRITVRYEDDNTITESRRVQQKSVSVAYNTATISASFLNYITTEDGRELVLEPIRRFKLDDNLGIVVYDPDMDQSPDRDQVTLQITSSNGSSINIIALETGEHTGEFLGKVFPILSEPKRDTEIQVTPGGTITAIYRDEENLTPGIPTDRTVTLEHALFKQPELGVYHTTSKPLPTPPRVEVAEQDKHDRGAEVITPYQSLRFVYQDQATSEQQTPQVVIGSTLRFDVLASHLAFAASSEVVAYVQTSSGRQAHQTGGESKSATNGNSRSNASSTMPFDVRVPGTMKLVAKLSRSAETIAPAGYRVDGDALASSNRPALDEGRFAFAVPVVLDTTPTRSYATEDAMSLLGSMLPKSLAVRPGDQIYIGFAYLDMQGKPQWLTATADLTSHAFLDIMDSRYHRDMVSAFVGEKLYIRVIAPERDTTPDRDAINVNLKAESGANVSYELRESEAHSGIFKGSFALNYASEKSDSETTSNKTAINAASSIVLHGLPVKYGDTVSVSYSTGDQTEPISLIVSVNKGADGGVEPFSKQYGEDGVAVQTTFTLAECFFELAKHHREMEQESLARREMAHAQKLLAEAITSHRDEELQAHAEYLLGNLAQEYADLSKNDDAKVTMYRDALARFTKIPLDYPDTEFAPKAQFKKGLVYEKLGEVDIAVEEYVKLAYKYPEHELIPSVMSRLGAYFQSQGETFKKQAESLEKEIEGDTEVSDETIGEALKLRAMSVKEYRNAAQVFAKLLERFPDDVLAGLAGLRSAQNYMRAGDYADAIVGFEKVVNAEEYDDKTIRSQAMFWSGISYERLGNPGKAYPIYRRVTFDFPDSVWAKQARGRLADPVFAKIIELENQARESMIEALRN